MHNARKARRCGQVDYHVGILMRLQERGGQHVGNFLFHRFLYDVGLIFAPSSEENLTCAEDGRDAHGDRTGRNGLLRAKAQRHFFARNGIDKYQARARSKHTTRLVRGDIAHTAHTKQHYINAAHVGNALLVLLATAVHHLLWHRSIKRKHVFGSDVHMVEKAFAQLADAAMWVSFVEREILVGVEHSHASKAQPMFLMAFDKLFEHGR